MLERREIDIGIRRLQRDERSNCLKRAVWKLEKIESIAKLMFSRSFLAYRSQDQILILL